MASPPPPGIFKPPAPFYSIATLLLIENSEQMYSRWPDLRDHYLPTLLGTMRMANPVVPIQVLWLTSCLAPIDDPSVPPQNSSRQFNQLPELRFNPQPNNHISLGTLHRGVDVRPPSHIIPFLAARLNLGPSHRFPLQLLASTFQKVPTTRHLFVVAASSPSDDADSSSSLPHSSDPRSGWKALAGKLKQLQLQEREESPVWFNVEHQKYFFYLSIDPQRTVAEGIAGLPGDLSIPNSINTTTNAHQYATRPTVPVPMRMPLPRNNSFPPAAPGYGYRQSIRAGPRSYEHEHEQQHEGAKPSLVKHLQKIHGLTKKRTYGLQPSRPPFVRDGTP
ncbi:hypothetical protein EW146_g7796, partial [Bondarzewia mesenterica]